MNKMPYVQKRGGVESSSSRTSTPPALIAFHINLSSLSVPISTVGHHAATVLGWVGCIFARTHFGFSYIAAAG